MASPSAMPAERAASACTWHDPVSAIKPVSIHRDSSRSPTGGLPWGLRRPNWKSVTEIGQMPTRSRQRRGAP